MLRRRLDSPFSNENGASDLFALVMLLLLVTSICIFFRAIACRRAELREEVDEARRITARTMAMESFERRGCMSEDDRRLFVQNFLVVQPYTESTETHHCAICLDKIQQSQLVGRSPNAQCDHVFHKSCIHEWLLVHEECPVCRRNYLQFDEPMRDEEDPTESVSDDEDGTVEEEATTREHTNTTTTMTLTEV